MIVESVIFVRILDIFYGSCPAPYTSSTCNIGAFVTYFKRLGWISGTLYTVLTLCLVATYVMLNQQLA